MTIHTVGKDSAEREARALAAKVGLPEEAMDKYPLKFSAGHLQRVAIAHCLTLDLEVLALDASVQAQGLNLMKDLQDDLSLAYHFNSHDLAVVRFVADEMLVMKDAEVVAQPNMGQILDTPHQAYTRKLLGAIPRG